MPRRAVREVRVAKADQKAAMVAKDFSSKSPWWKGGGEGWGKPSYGLWDEWSTGDGQGDGFGNISQELC